MNTADLIGIFGVVCYQIAYAGMQLGLLQREDRSYLILNLFGPCCLLYSLLFHFNMAAAISQVLWLIWSCVGMAKVSLTRRQASIVAMGSDLSLIRRRGRSPRLRNTQFWLRCRFSENSREEMTRKSSE